MLTLTRPACFPHPDCPTCEGGGDDRSRPGVPDARCPTCGGDGGLGMCDPCRAYSAALCEFHLLTDQWPAKRRVAWLLRTILGEEGEG